MRIDCEFPGGNIIVEKIDGDAAWVRQDLRDTEGDWFWFNFRLLDAAGRRVSIHFTQSKIIGGVGRRACERQRAFTVAIPEWSNDTRIAFGLENWKRVQEFAAALVRVRHGPLPYDSKHNLPCGKPWDSSTGPARSCGGWSLQLPGILFGTALEMPYANAGGAVVTPESAREFGHDMARAIAVYLALPREHTR